MADSHADSHNGRRLRWTRFASVLSVLNLGYAVVGAVLIGFEHEGPVRVLIAWLIGLFGTALLRVAWRSAGSGHGLVARVLVTGVTGACGALALVTTVTLVGRSWGGNGVITDAKLAEVYIGETKAAVHEALGNPLQHMPADPSLQQWLGDGPGEDCDVYEKDPGLQGGLYAHVCYLNGRVTRVTPFI